MEMKNVRAIICENYNYGKKSSFTCMITHNNGTKKDSATQFEDVDMIRLHSNVMIENGVYFGKDKMALKFEDNNKLICSSSNSYNDASKIDISCFKQNVQ